MSAKKSGIKKVLRKPEARLEYEQERLLLATQECLARAIEASGLSQAEVARRIGHDRSFVTNALSTGRNLTLRTIAALAWATEHRIEPDTVSFTKTEYGHPLYRMHSPALHYKAGAESQYEPGNIPEGATAVQNDDPYAAVP